MDTEAAKTAYKFKQQEIMEKMNVIKNIVTWQHAGETINYGHVGDLGHVNDQLAQLLVFLKDEEE